MGAMNRRHFLKTSLLGIYGYAGLPSIAFGRSQADALDALAQVCGTNIYLIKPSDAKYSTARRSFNLRRLSQPVGIAQIKTEKILPEILKWSNYYRIPLHIRGGGHSYEGESSGPGLVVDLAPLNTISFSQDGERVYVGAGVRLGGLYQSLAQKGRMIPAGSCLTVGISGLTLGGGHGLATRKFGLTLDCLKSVKIFTPQGEFIRASIHENPDLFWVCRGAGTVSGLIVTEFEFETYGIKNVDTFTMQFPTSSAHRVLEIFEKMIPELIPEVSMILKFEAVAGNGLTKVRIVGQHTSEIESTSSRHRNLRNALSPFTTVFGSSSLSVVERSFLQSIKYFSGGEDPPVYFKAKSDYAMTPIAGTAGQEFLQAISQWSHGSVAVLLDSYGGKVGEVSPDATAFAHRDALYCVQYYTQWTQSDTTQSRLQAMRQLHEKTHKLFSGMSYINYLDADIGEPFSYFGSNWERVKQIQSQYETVRQFPKIISEKI